MRGGGLGGRGGRGGQGPGVVGGGQGAGEAGRARGPGRARARAGVLRFTNAEVVTDLDFVLQEIAKHLNVERD